MSKTNTAEFGKLEMESGQSLVALTTLTDNGDHLKFTSSATHFSNKSGFTPEIYPQGVVSPRACVIPAVSGTNDLVDTVEIRAYIDGVLTTVAASTDETCLRGAAADYRVNSITITDGGAIAVVSGTENAAQSEVRAAAGGPPLIPVGSIEVAQVRCNSQVAAAITTDEILEVVGQHQERWDFPTWDEDNFDGEIDFATAQPLIHTGPVAKEVWAKVYDPIFAELSLASDFIPSENSHSVDSTQIYNNTVGASSSSLTQGSFVAYLKDGVNDAVIAEKDSELFFRFYPDRNKVAYVLDQGKLGVSRTFPAGDNIKAACTISAESAAVAVPV
jgi:hypothetical protein